MADQLGKIFEQPLVYIIILVFSVLLYVANINKDAGIILGFLSMGGFALYTIRGSGQVLINKTKGNTLESLSIAAVGVAIVVVAALIISAFLKILPIGQGASISSFQTFLEFAKSAVLGSATSPLANNPALTFAIFVIAFPIAETFLLAQFYDYMVKSFGGTLAINNMTAIFVAALMGIVAIFYHIGVKVTTSGDINPNSLLIIFTIFFVECLIIAYTRDVEAAIWHHIINNAISVGAITIAALTNPFVIAIIVLIFLSVTNKLNIRKWFA